MTKYIYHSEQTKTTCEQCKKNDGKIYYDIKDIPKLPIHPNCKCYIETIEDEKENNNNNPDNKNSNNPANNKSQNNNPQPQNPPCDCKDRISVVQNNAENIITNSLNLIKDIENKIYEREIENLSTDKLYELKKTTENFIKQPKDINCDIEILKEETINLPHTKKECPIDNRLKEITGTIKTMNETINSYKETFNELKKEESEEENTEKKVSVPLPKDNRENEQEETRDKIKLLGKLPLKQKDETIQTQKLFSNNEPFKLHAVYNESSTEGDTKNNTCFSDETLRKAKQFIVGYEGYRAEAYQDTGGIWTIGYGHTKGVKKGDKITEKEAEKLFREDFEAHARALAEVKVPLTENQKIALASFIYNVGYDAFTRSTLFKKLNNGDYNGAAKEFDIWNKDANGQILQGLINRRKKEKELFLTPN